MADRKYFLARCWWLILYCAFLAVGFSFLADVLPQLSARPRWSLGECLLALGLPALLVAVSVVAMSFGFRAIPTSSPPHKGSVLEDLLDRDTLNGAAILTLIFHTGWIVSGWVGGFSASVIGLTLGLIYMAAMIAILGLGARNTIRNERLQEAKRHDDEARIRAMVQVHQEEDRLKRKEERRQNLARQRERLEHARLVLLREHMDLFPFLDKEAWAQPRVMELTRIPEDLDAAADLPSRYESLAIAMRLEAARNRILRDYDRAALQQLGLTDRAQLERLLDEIVNAARSRKTIAPADAFAHLQAVENRLATVLASDEARAITEEQRARAYEAIFDDDLLRVEARRPLVAALTRVDATSSAREKNQESAHAPSRHDA